MVNNVLALLGNKTSLLIIMAVLIVFIVLLAVVGIVLITQRRKREPTVKVLFKPDEETQDAAEQEDAVTYNEELPEPVPDPEPVREVEPVWEEPVYAQAPEVQEEPVYAQAPEVQEEAVYTLPPEALKEDAPIGVYELPDEDEDDTDDTIYVTEGQERVRYDRSFTAKLSQLKDESKKWYFELKNELLSYERVKSRISWKKETFRIGRSALAKFVIRGKTLCVLLAVDPAGYAGTKYTVEDVSDAASTADTPTLYRIRSARRLKYAKEMIAGIMGELKLGKKAKFEANEYDIPYEDDASLISRGLIKRIVSFTTRTIKVEKDTSTDTDGEAAVTADGATDEKKDD